VSHPIREHVPSMKAALALAALAVLAFIPATADGADALRRGPAQQVNSAWTRTLNVDLSARDLGLPVGASARRLARAALAREAGRLGLPRSLRGVRVVRTQHVPRAAGGAGELDLLRFQQTAGGLRVVWSQVDVTVAAGRVSAITATVVPVTGKRLAGKRRVSRERALGIARRAVSGPEQALQPLRVAYAGKPTSKGDARSRIPRLAWVVETTAASELDAEVPTSLCIVIDAETGKVIGRWAGMAARPDRGPQARGADASGSSRPAPRGATVRAAQANPTQFMLDVFDGTTDYSSFVIDGDPHDGANWPQFNKPCVRRSAPRPCVNFFVSRSAALDALGANAENVARTICSVRNYCGRLRGLQGDSGFYAPWLVTGNADRSRALISNLTVQIASGHEMYGNGDPRLPFNDVVAHEFGHVMDWVYAGDRFVGGTSQQAREAQEGLADMFAYDYDRADATLGEEARNVLIRNWANPGAERLEGRPYPAHMDDYDDTPFPNEPDEHFNSTILSHAYYLFVQAVGHNRAGRVLHSVPQRLSPRPSFQEVANAFALSADDIFGDDLARAAAAAFLEVGLGQTRRILPPVFP
jgi:Zn-dependent metalloprotease